MPQPMPDFVPGREAAPGVPRASGEDAAAPDDEQSASTTRGIRALVRNPLATFVAGGALVAAAFVAAPAVVERARAGTEAQLAALVSEYVAALEAGDVATASALAPVDEDYADASLLGVVQPVRPASFDCAPATFLDDVATVSCDVAVAPSTMGSSMRMRLVRDDAWRIETGLAVASPLQTGIAEPRAIDGEALDAEVASGTGAVWLYPGAYALDLQVPELLDATDELLVVDGYGAMWHGLGAPTAEAQEEIAAAATDHLALCGETDAVGCPAFTPLAEGERLESTFEGWSYSTAEPRITADVAVARIGGAPDRWRVRVELVFADDLQSYELIATARPDVGEP